MHGAPPGEGRQRRLVERQSSSAVQGAGAVGARVRAPAALGASPAAVRASANKSANHIVRVCLRLSGACTRPSRRDRTLAP